MQALADEALDLELPGEPARARSAVASGVLLALFLALGSALALAVLVLLTDPTPSQERLFVLLLLVLGTGLATLCALLFGARGASPLADVLRAYRRGILAGLACAGTAVLQFNAALTPTNLAFLLLVLLIVEMIFLARRQHPA